MTMPPIDAGSLLIIHEQTGSLPRSDRRSVSDCWIPAPSQVPAPPVEGDADLPYAEYGLDVALHVGVYSAGDSTL